ncbi:MAG: hypothetical protein ABI045_05650 [Flavobacteriales bacterium]
MKQDLLQCAYDFPNEYQGGGQGMEHLVFVDKAIRLEEVCERRTIRLADQLWMVFDADFNIAITYCKSRGIGCA